MKMYITININKISKGNCKLDEENHAEENHEEEEDNLVSTQRESTKPIKRNRNNLKSTYERNHNAEDKHLLPIPISEYKEFNSGKFKGSKSAATSVVKSLSLSSTSKSKSKSKLSKYSMESKNIKNAN